MPKKCRLGPQNGSGSSGPEKLLKVVKCAIIKETEKTERNNGGATSGIGGWPPISTWINPFLRCKKFLKPNQFVAFFVKIHFDRFVWSHKYTYLSRWFSSFIGFFLVDDVDSSRSSLLDRLLQEWCKAVDHLGSLMMMMIKDGLMMTSAKWWFWWGLQ